jgi:hypothetical protein
MSFISFVITAVVCVYIGRKLSSTKIDIPRVVVNPIDGVIQYIRRGRDSGCAAYAIIVIDDGRAYSPIRIEVIPSDGRKMESFTVETRPGDRPTNDQVSRRIAMVVASKHTEYLNIRP